jgi:putative addiction module component (TIGR02574 family)
MALSRAEIVEAAKLLDPEARSDLIDELIVSLPPIEPNALRTELDRRMADHAANPASAITLEQLRERVKKRHRL